MILCNSYNLHVNGRYDENRNQNSDEVIDKYKNKVMFEHWPTTTDHYPKAQRGNGEGNGKADNDNEYPRNRDVDKCFAESYDGLVPEMNHN